MLLDFFRRERDPAVAAQRHHWADHGYLVLPGLVAAEVCDAVSAAVAARTGPDRAALGSKATVDVLHGPLEGRLLRACTAPDAAFDGPFKLNNLFVEAPELRRAMFHPALHAALTRLVGAAPMAINSLNFVYGSRQPQHIDSWYMPAPKPGGLIVASICLEDVDADAGPLFYYPGSHKIPPYKFSHGGIHAVDAEMDACRAYVEAQVSRRGLKREIFLGKKGDVFIWHSQLLHGGSLIVDPTRTRRSLVVHYWGEDSVEVTRRRAFGAGQTYLDRDYWNCEDAMDDTTKTPTTNAVATEQGSGLRAAFETWEGRDESLESVEARIHDGVPQTQLHARADGYLQTFDTLFPFSRPAPGGAMMEIGSGLAYVMQAALTRYQPARLIGLDVAAGMIAHAKQRLQRDGVDAPGIEFVHYDGVDVPLADGALDHVYSVASLQHAPRPYCFRAMVEALRVVKRGGWVRIHLLAHTHFREHMDPARFNAELEQQIRGTAGHWHHYYAVDELESVLRHGVGAKDVHVREHRGSIFLVYRR